MPTDHAFIAQIAAELTRRRIEQRNVVIRRRIEQLSVVIRFCQNKLAEVDSELQRVQKLP